MATRIEGERLNKRADDKQDTGWILAYGNENGSSMFEQMGGGTNRTQVGYMTVEMEGECLNKWEEAGKQGIGRK